MKKSLYNKLLTLVIFGLGLATAPALAQSLPNGCWEGNALNACLLSDKINDTIIFTPTPPIGGKNIGIGLWQSNNNIIDINTTNVSGAKNGLRLNRAQWNTITVSALTVIDGDESAILLQNGSTNNTIDIKAGGRLISGKDGITIKTGSHHTTVNVSGKIEVGQHGIVIDRSNGTKINIRDTGSIDAKDGPLEEVRGPNFGILISNGSTSTIITNEGTIYGETTGILLNTGKGPAR